jgi:hypothetical protein
MKLFFQYRCRACGEVFVNKAQHINFIFPELNQHLGLAIGSHKHADKSVGIADLIGFVPEQKELPIIQVGMDGRCLCSCADKCVLGRVGSQERCTSADLERAGYHVTLKPQPEKVIDKPLVNSTACDDQWSDEDVAKGRFGLG